MKQTKVPRGSRAATIILAAALATGCGSDKKSDGSDGHPLGGADGGNGSMDASTSDIDASSQADASVGDAATSGDAAVVSATCERDAEELSLPIDGRGSHTWDALQVGDTIHLVYEVTVCEDQIVAQAQRLDYLSFGSTGAFGQPEQLVNYAQDACFFTRTPTLAPGASDPLLYYSSTNSGASELYQLQIGAAAQPVRLTTDSESMSDAEEHTVAVPFGPSNLLAYVNAYAATQQVAIGHVVTRRAASSEQTIVSADLGLHISGLALAAFDASNDLGGVLAWVADVGDTPSISIQVLDKAGKPSGKPVSLTKQVGTFSNVAIAMLPHGTDAKLAGAIVYGIAPDDLHTELRFRTLGLDGTVGDEVRLTTGNRNAQGVAIAPFASGYAVAYRVVSADSAIHVKVIDKQGETASGGERVLVDAESSGSPPKLFVTSDGRINVVFSDTNGDGTTLRAVRATCDP